MAKIAITINLNPETDKERENQDIYQNASYTLGGLKSDTKIDEINDTIYNWIKEQKK